MKRIATAILVAFFIGTAFSESTAAPNGQLDQILNNMQKAAAQIKAIYAKMDQAKRDAAMWRSAVLERIAETEIDSGLPLRTPRKKWMLVARSDQILLER